MRIVPAFAGLMVLASCAIAPYPYDIEKAYPYRYTLSVLNEGDGTLSLIGIRTTETSVRLFDFHVEGTEVVPVGDDPISLAFHYPQAGKGLYPDEVAVLNRKGKDIAVVDLRTTEVIERITLPADADPVDMAYSGGVLYVADRAHNNLLVSPPMEGFAGAVFTSIGTGVTPIAIREGEGLLYILGENDKTIITISGGITQATVYSIEGIPVDLQYASDLYRTRGVGYGGIIGPGTYLLTMSPDNIYQILWGAAYWPTTSGDALSASAFSDFVPRRLFITPDGGFLFVSFQGAGSVFEFSDPGAGPLTLAPGDSPGGFASLPSGNAVFMSQPSLNIIAAYGLRGTPCYAAIPAGMTPGAMAVTFAPASAPGAEAL